jgi:hypothetical protein
LRLFCLQYLMVFFNINSPDLISYIFLMIIFIKIKFSN